MKKFFFLVLVAISFFTSRVLVAQDVNATVYLDPKQLSSSDRTALAGVPQALMNYINSYQWAGGNWTLPPVTLSLQISISQSLGGGGYSAQLLAISSRAVAGGGESMTVLRVVDNNWQFSYTQNQPMQHINGMFNSLTSMIDCYVYLALGCTADSYADLGGSDFFHQASDICAQGQTSGYSAGWTETQGAEYGRTSFVEELLSPRFEPVRHLIYTYYHGRDILASQPDEGNKDILNVVDSLVLFKNHLGGPSLLLDRLTDAKYLEFGAFFVNFPDKGTIYDELETIDPTHQSFYEDFRNK